MIRDAAIMSLIKYQLFICARSVKSQGNAASVSYGFFLRSSTTSHLFETFQLEPVSYSTRTAHTAYNRFMLRPLEHSAAADLRPVYTGVFSV